MKKTIMLKQRETRSKDGTIRKDFAWIDGDWNFCSPIFPSMKEAEDFRKDHALVPIESALVGISDES